MQVTWSTGAGAAVVSLLTFLAAYRIPFHFPPPRAVSQSYVVGFNNKVAIALVALMSVSVALWSTLSSRQTLAPADEFTDGEPLPRWILLVGCAASALWIGLVSWAVLRASSPSYEDFYFLPQLEKYFFHHRPLYREIEFAYGPLLFYSPLPVYWFLSPWKVSIEAAYYVALVLHHVLGLGLLFYLVNALPLPRRTRLGVFAAVGLLAFNLLLGPNYTLLRFTLPLASFILLHRLLSRPNGSRLGLAWCAVATVLQFATSSEMGVAFSVGCCFYAVYCGLTTGRAYLLLLPSLLLGVLLSGVVLGRAYFASIAHFAGGLNNKVIYPSLDTAAVLACAVWFAPRLAGREIAHRSRRAPLLSGLFAISIALLPAAFGVSDAVHNYCNGLGLLLLAVVECSTRPMQRRLCLSALAILSAYGLVRVDVASFLRISPAVAVLDSHHVVYGALRNMSHTAAGQLASVPVPLPEVPLEELETATGHQPYNVPLSLPRFAIQRLLRSPDYLPGYFEGTINAWGPDAQRIKVAEIQSAAWIVAPVTMRPSQIAANVDEPYTRHIHYPVRHMVTTDDLVQAEIRDHWTLVEQYPLGIGLYHRK